MGCCLWGLTESDMTEVTQQQQQQQQGVALVLDKGIEEKERGRGVKGDSS